LLCDEIAVGIHSSKLSDFVRQLAWTAKKYNCQIIATTHSYELLAAACEAFSGENLNPDDFAYIRMDRDSHGKIAATRFDHRSLGDAIAANWEVR
jgi:AAA15 family ATPase/GTPase